ncbi:glycosyltransferase [bacterium]|nr:glycosyltransferase [bacterium]
MSMLQEPKVSVVVPTYNRPKGLEHALRSILDGRFQDFEILVVNDAGQPVEGVIRTLNDKRITYIVHPQNKGLPAARNTALKLARGQYIAYLDDDDIWYENHLETLVAEIQRGKEAVVYSDGAQSQVRPGPDGPVEHAKKPSYGFEYSRDLMLVSNYIPVLCILHERRILEETGLFDESLTSHEDWEMWIRVSRTYDFRRVPVETTEYVIDLDPQKQDRRRRAMFDTLVQIYERTEPLLDDRPDLIEARKDHIRKYMADIQQSTEILAAMEQNSPPPQNLLGVSLESELRANPNMVRRLPTLQGYLNRGKHDLVARIVRKELPESDTRRLLLEKLEQL